MRKQPEWMSRVRVGDVLRGKRSDRVVRAVSFFSNGQLHSVCFAIKHCSWTKRAYTTLGYTDLKQADYQPTRLKVKLKTRMDRRIARDLKYDNRFKQKLDCCDVIGVP